VAALPDAGTRDGGTSEETAATALACALAVAWVALVVGMRLRRRWGY
jgi:hypothetical protein